MTRERTEYLSEPILGGHLLSRDAKFKDVVLRLIVKAEKERIGDERIHTALVGISSANILMLPYRFSTAPLLPLSAAVKQEPRDPTMLPKVVCRAITKQSDTK